jgi:hypothetical protein
MRIAPRNRPLALIAFVVLLFVSIGAASAQTQGPFQSTSNISADITGVPDKRPGGWGLHQADPVRLKITAPAGYRVRILEVAGDLVAWPKSGTIQGGQYAEVGWGLNTSLKDGSRFMSYPDDPAAIAYDNCIIWVQDVLTSGHGTVRVPFDRKYDNVFLNDTGVFYTQPFVALNTSGLQIHLEPTVTVTYRFEKAAPAK